MLLTDDQASRISADGLIHDAIRLKELQALPLYRKIGISIARIGEWYMRWDGKVYVSFSGGKDSTVLLHLARSFHPEIPAVFSNTGLEYPELQKFVRGFDNVTVLYPKMKFHEVLSKYGYPLIGKEVAEAIYYARRIAPTHTHTHTHRTTARKQAELLGLRPASERHFTSVWNCSDSATGGGEKLNVAGKTCWGNGNRWNRGNRLAQLA